MKDSRNDRERQSVETVREVPSAATEPRPVGCTIEDDAAAFEALVRRHYDGVWRLVHRIVRREPESEAVVEEVFLAARAALPQDEGEVQFCARLRRLALERAAQAVKPGRSRLQKLDRRPGAPERRRALPHIGIERDRRLLEAGLATLEGPQRVSLALHLEGLDYSEMANTLGIPITAARNRLLVVRAYLSRSVFPDGKR
jgi:RNA polymerase sigma-70 factor (ECF subfamily)